MSKKLFDAALQSHRAGDFKKAERLYKQLLEKDSHNADVMHLLGILNAQQQHYEEALVYVESALNEDPKAPSYHNSLGNIYKNLEKLDKAVECYDKALALQPDNAVSHNSLGNVYRKMEKIDKAMSHYQKAIRLKPDYADAIYNLGLAFSKQERLKDAESRFEEVITLQPEHVEAHTQLGQLFHRQGKDDEAENHYKIALKHDPDEPEAHHGLGAVLVKRGDFDQAIEHFKKTLLALPNHVEAYHNIGACFLAMGNPIAALKYYLRLLSLGPDVDAYYNLGVIYMYQDKHEDAINYFHEALGLDPDHVNTHTNLAGVYLKKGDYENAVKHYQAVLALRPGDKEIEYILSAISKPKKIPKEAPSQYLEHLFDQYAPYYDEHLLKQLQYKAPQLLCRAVSEVADVEEADWTILDLGCGTGLSGVEFRKLAGRLIGIDISSKMIEMAKRRDIYDELSVEEITAALAKRRDLDLIVAADTFIYIGDLKVIFKSARKALKKGALFAFTVERTDDEADQQEDYLLRRTARYAHSKHYIESLAKKNHFAIERCDDVVTRQQMRKPVEAFLFVLVLGVKS